MESRNVTAARIAIRLARQSLPEHLNSRSSNAYELPQLAACVLMKFHLQLSFRDTERWLLENRKVCEVFGLARVPHHTTLQRTYGKLRSIDFENLSDQILEEEQSGGPRMDTIEDVNSLPSEGPSWISRAMLTWLAGIVILMPIKILDLPLNLELVDVWSIAGMPVVVYLYGLRRLHRISSSYAIPMWFVLVGSLMSAFASTAPVSSLIVVLKEVYLFVWFFVVMGVLFQMSSTDTRAVLRVWSMVVVGHGCLMIAQFLSPEIWQLTNALGGNSARLDGYRAAGLFICDKAGCANKAAFFQLLGFVPLLLAGFSGRKTILLGSFLFFSMMTAGSMGATLAFLAGLSVALVAIAHLKNSLSIVLKYILGIGLALLILAGAVYIVSSLKADKLNHFERIIVGRYDRSSGGRLDLWGRGLDVLLDHGAFVWGVGPENFREVDPSGNDNQLHNDALAFLVERGLLGLIGLGLFAGITLSKAIDIQRICRAQPQRAGLGVVVFLAALAATTVESLTHQVFHTRELWLILALQEAVLYKMMNTEHGIEPTVRPVPEPARARPRVAVLPEAS